MLQTSATLAISCDQSLMRAVETQGSALGLMLRPDAELDVSAALSRVNGAKGGVARVLVSMSRQCVGGEGIVGQEESRMKVSWLDGNRRESRTGWHNQHDSVDQRPRWLCLDSGLLGWLSS